MSVGNYFSIFCSNLSMSSSNISKIQSRYKNITKSINASYRNSASETSNSLYVGSYGRGTKVWTSDIDIIVCLPYRIYQKFNGYRTNGQSALLQEVKSVLQQTYSTSHLKGDGQVIGLNFKDNISFEIVPVFKNENGSYTYPDTNDGGKWRVTDPLNEIKAMNAHDQITNKNLKRLCRMARAWKVQCNVPISGMLIDTLAYKFLDVWPYKEKSYFYYDYMSRDFFDYLRNVDINKNYWSAPGSLRRVWNNDRFQSKASKAYNLSQEAINAEFNNSTYTSKQRWREIYGTKFPD